MIEVSFTMLLQWINFGMLIFLLTFFLYKPLMNVLDKRRAMVQGDLEEAKKKKEESEELLRQYQQRLDNLRLEGRKIIDEARKEAAVEKEKMIEAAHHEAKVIVENAHLEVDSHVHQVRDEIKKEAAELIVGCASQVLEREIQKEDHQKYIDEFIEKTP